MNTIDTTNKIFRISCGAEFALKLIGVMKPRPILELPPRFGVPAPIWRSPGCSYTLLDISMGVGSKINVGGSYPRKKI